MAFDSGLAERIRDTLRDSFGDMANIQEKKMFGGLAFMSRSYMFVGIVGDNLMARVGAPLYEEMLQRPHVRPMDFTGKPLKGYVYVSPEGFENDADLADWVALCYKFVQTLPEKK